MTTMTTGHAGQEQEDEREKTRGTTLEERQFQGYDAEKEDDDNNINDECDDDGNDDDGGAGRSGT